MVKIEYILFVNTALFCVLLIVLLIISSMKSRRPKKENIKISDEMIKIKEQISEDLD